MISIPLTNSALLPIVVLIVKLLVISTIRRQMLFLKDNANLGIPFNKISIPHSNSFPLSQAVRTS